MKDGVVADVSPSAKQGAVARPYTPPPLPQQPGASAPSSVSSRMRWAITGAVFRSPIIGAVKFAGGKMAMGALGSFWGIVLAMVVGISIGFLLWYRSGAQVAAASNPQEATVTEKKTQ